MPTPASSVKRGRPLSTGLLTRDQARLVGKVSTVRAKRADLEKMLAACDRERDRALLAADDAGIAKAELARAYGVTPSSIIGYLRSARAELAARAAERNG